MNGARDLRGGWGGARERVGRGVKLCVFESQALVVLRRWTCLVLVGCGRGCGRERGRGWACAGSWVLGVVV